MNERDIDKSIAQKEQALRQRILEVRFTDLDLERDLCKELLNLTEVEHLTYGYAFANIYMVDCLVALGEYDDCDFYLARALYLCNENQYDDLHLILCNLAGLYYQSLNDEQSALGYFLKGLELSSKLNDHITKGKLLCNIGRGFSWREDWVSTKKYIERAYETIKPYLQEDDTRANAVSYLGNLAIAYQSQGDEKSSEQVLSLCEKYSENKQYDLIRQAAAWCSHCSSFGYHERCLAQADKMIELGVFTFDNKYFAHDMCLEVCNHMLDLDEREVATRFLNFLVESKPHMPLNTRFRVQALVIRYEEQFGITEGLLEAYEEHYQLLLGVQELDGKARVQSLFSQIRLRQVAEERAELGEENRVLEQVGQVDDLTKLYNRRYFRKLLSKTAQDATLTSLGCILLDVDHFKNFNDLYGHFYGDTALKTVAEVLTNNASKGFIPGRYGGDEFICLCINRTDEEVQDYIECMCADLEQRDVAHEASQTSKRLTLSIGWCNEPAAQGIDPERLVRVADEALYEVKERGRNGQVRKRLEG